MPIDIPPMLLEGGQPLLAHGVHDALVARREVEVAGCEHVPPQGASRRGVVDLGQVVKDLHLEDQAAQEATAEQYVLTQRNGGVVLAIHAAPTAVPTAVFVVPAESIDADAQVPVPFLIPTHE